MTQPERQSTLNSYAAASGQNQNSPKDEHAARDPQAAKVRTGQQPERPEQEGEPATEKQLAFLEALRIPVPEGLAKRAASRLIDEGKARRLAERLDSF